MGMQAQKGSSEKAFEEDDGTEFSDKEEDIQPVTKWTKVSAKLPMSAGQNNAFWHPHQVIAACENTDGVNFCTVIMALTGGTADTTMDGVHVRVNESGSKIMICWMDI
jgi:hypothetical protein